jgi:DNA-binding MarR family transcriptional regulator
MIKINIQEIDNMDVIATDEALKLVIDQYWETVPLVWNQIRSHLRSIAMEQFDISVGQFYVLRHIRKGLTSVRDIADARQISRPAISQEVDLLVEKGLITRKQEADDRRFVHLALTNEGEALLSNLFSLNRAWMMERMAQLNADDLNHITGGLRLLKSAFDSAVE